MTGARCEGDGRPRYECGNQVHYYPIVIVPD